MQHSLAAQTLAQLTCHLAGDSLLALSIHIAKHLAYAVIRHNVQEWRLFKLHRQRLLQRAIEYHIARGVGEIRQDDGVFLSEGASATAIKENTCHRNSRQRQRRGRQQPNFPVSSN